VTNTIDQQHARVKHKPVVLTILDGWGLRDSTVGNAIAQANTPCFDQLMNNYPHARLQASGLEVGLPQGQMGNSEVGHLNIGAGRIIYQDLTRITKSIADGDFFTNPALVAAMEKTLRRQGKLHLMGLLSNGGVHSLNTHLYALIKMATQRGIKDICIHAFLDGRDTPPSSAATYLEQLEAELQQQQAGRIATICGRFYAMDRDKRWDRVEKAYRALTLGEGHKASDSKTAIETAYANGQTDEFVEPTIVGAPAPVLDGDGIIFFNFRADRAREISAAFTTQNFSGFNRGKRIDLADYVCMTEYDQQLRLPVAFPPDSYPNILAESIANAGLKQLHLAETEKYAHVTFFFNGGNEEPFSGEERILIPSPQDVATYDEKPRMSVDAVAQQILENIDSDKYDFIVVNFANPDMVGHTGIMSAAVAAVEAVDSNLQLLVDKIIEHGGAMLVTADHGNCEQMVDNNGQPQTAHTTNEVPLIYVASDANNYTMQNGKLADIAPTLLNMLNLPIPAEMTGHNLRTSR